ncbi:hypothetical protein ACWCQK_38275 [Streptomyces sp. NPDC002306]
MENTTSDRFHLVLAVDGRPVVQGWWSVPEVARKNATEWIGLSAAPSAHVTLVDTTTGKTMTEWPTPPVDEHRLPDR